MQINIGLVAIILVLLFIIAELYRWNFTYRKLNKMLEKQNEDVVAAYNKLSDEFVLQFAKYNKESEANTKRVDAYTKMYSSMMEMTKEAIERAKQK